MRTEMDFVLLGYLRSKLDGRQSRLIETVLSTRAKENRLEG